MQKFEPTWTAFQPVASERVIEGRPATRLAQSINTDTFTSGFWEVTPGRFATAPKGFDEVIHILSGSGVLRSNDGDSVELAPGVTFLMEDGFVGEWEIREPLQKLYTKVTAPPAG